MKKSIFTITFIILSILFSASFVFAAENNVENVKNNMVDTVNNAGNVVQDTASGAAGAVKNGLNAIGNTTQNMTNSVNNAGNDMMNNTDNNMMNTDNNSNSDYTATRTATENNTETAGGYNNMWTWIIVGIIAIVIIALIWYYVSQNNH